PHLQAAAERLGNAAPWLALAEADALADAGDTEAVRQAVAGYTGGLHGLRAWRAPIKAARAAGDLEAARRLAVQARTWASTNTTRAEFFLEEGRAALDLGDTAAGRSALRGAIARDESSAYARDAADLLQDGRVTAADHLAVARVLRAQGLH